MRHTHLKPIQQGSRPIAPGISDPTCPILLEARQLLEKAQDLQRAIRSLRRSTQRCPTCPNNLECPTMRYFAQAVDTAIREVRREWGLDKE
ncbi:MAG: hypothetical protein ACM3H7_02325 [Acidobacteriaceae bacterium]